MTVKPRTKRVMVVDDDADIVQVIRSALRKYDIVTDGFTEPEAALEHFRLGVETYSLVISDVRMPGMSGFEFLEQVKKINSRVKVMMITAYFADMLAIPKALDGIITRSAILEKPSCMKTICMQVQNELQTI